LALGEEGQRAVWLGSPGTSQVWRVSREGVMNIRWGERKGGVWMHRFMDQQMGGTLSLS
jgi:hypothetical protein